MRSSSRAATPRPRRQAPEALSVLTFDLDLGPGRDLALGQEDQVRGLATLPLVAPEALPEQPLGPIALDGPPQLPARRQAQPIVTAVVREGDQAEEPAVQPHPAAQDPAVIGPGGQPLVRTKRRPRAAAHVVRPRSASGPS